MKTSSPYRFTWFDWFCLAYPPAWLILFNRHWQHYHEDPEGWISFEYCLFLIPFGFYLALFCRWLRLGCRSPHDFTPGKMEPDYQQAFREEVLAPIVQRYFRAELEQSQFLPQDQQPVIVVMNHAGMCFPWDFLSLGYLLGQQGWNVQPLAHRIFFDHPWLRWWLPSGWSQLLGGIQADRPHFEQAIQQQQPGHAILYAPEGWRGIAKGWPQRHQLATFDPSFIQLSQHYQIPLLPVLCLGSEYLHPWAWNFKNLARWFKLPMFPLSPLILLFLMFPSMGVWGNRTHLRYCLQALYQPWQEVNATPSRQMAYTQAQSLRSVLQQRLNQMLPSIATISPPNQTWSTTTPSPDINSPQQQLK